MSAGKLLKKEKGSFRYTQSGLDNIILEGVPNYICGNCKTREWEVPCSEELHLMIGFILILKPKHLTGKEACFLRKHLGYTAEDFGNVIGVKRVAVTKWETNAANLTGSNDKHIRRIYLSKKGPDIEKTPSVMRIVNTLIGFINLDNDSTEKEFKIKSEDWAACASG